MSTRTWDALIGFGLLIIGAALIAASWLLPWPYDLLPGAVCVVAGSVVLVIHDWLTTWQRRRRSERRGGYLL
jgi:membrane protein implicated in regulation of membrane protease activity